MLAESTSSQRWRTAHHRPQVNDAVDPFGRRGEPLQIPQVADHGVLDAGRRLQVVAAQPVPFAETGDQHLAQLAGRAGDQHVHSLPPVALTLPQPGRP